MTTARKNPLARSCIICIAGIALLLPVPAGLFAQADNSNSSDLPVVSVPSEIDLGEMASGGIRSATVRLRNPGRALVSIRFSSACPCVRFSPATLDIPPAEDAETIVTFDSQGYSGEVTKPVFVTSENAPLSGSQLTVLAIVGATDEGDTVECPSCEAELERLAGLAPAPPAPPVEPRALGSEGPLEIDLYLDIGCLKCINFLDNRIPELEAEYGREINVTRWDVMGADTMGALISTLARHGLSVEELPIAQVGTEFFQGLDEIDNGLASILSGTETGADHPVETPGDNARSDTTVFSAPAVLLAGLVDGINPCAFSTILFLISMLALVGRSRREILVVGIVYTVVVFVGYTAVGLGLFASVRALLVFPRIASAIRWLLVAVLAVLACLSTRDAWLASRGRAREMTLQLSDTMKQRIHSVVRNRVKSVSIVAGTVVLGLLVTVFEFSCTGQVYLPVIVHLARQETRATALLLLYNFAFILPLVLVFAAAYSGVAMEKVSAYFRKHLVAVKVGLAAVFILLAVTTVLF